MQLGISKIKLRLGTNSELPKGNLANDLFILVMYCRHYIIKMFKTKINQAICMDTFSYFTHITHGNIFWGHKAGTSITVKVCRN